MYRIRNIFVLMFATVVSVAAQTNTYNIIPKPAKLTPQQGQFIFNSDTRIIVPTADADMHNAVFLLLERIILATGFRTQIVYNIDDEIKPDKNMIFCRLAPKMTNAEAYRITIGKDRIEIEAGAAAGFFYAMQTIRQLLPPEINGNVPSRAKDVVWAVPCVIIEDEPRFQYRGMMLDVSRHFSDISSIRRYIDWLAFHKINHFHWHLTDDQGWRIEIKKYPKLTEVGAWRDSTLAGHYSDTIPKYKKQRYGGYYTQEQVKQIVAYAKRKFVTVIPEIEMPGHAIAALASYPELSCTNGEFAVASKWGIFDDVFCTKDETFEFLENVLAEVIELFPCEYIHIGGDECSKLRWENCRHCQAKIEELGLKDENELQSYFITRIGKFVNSKGKRIIGWDEILDGGLASDATVMSWRGFEGGVAAAKQGSDVIMSPAEFCYFDYYQTQSRTNEPLAIGGYLNMEKAYSFNPVPEGLTDDDEKHILGGQCNLWSEYIVNGMQAEYMLFPRLAAFSEAVWTPINEKDYENFLTRLDGILKHYKTLNILYSLSNLQSSKSK